MAGLAQILSASSKVILPAIHEGFVIAGTAMEVVSVQAEHREVTPVADDAGNIGVLLYLLAGHPGNHPLTVLVVGGVHLPEKHELLMTLARVRVAGVVHSSDQISVRPYVDVVHELESLLTIWVKLLNYLLMDQTHPIDLLQLDAASRLGQLF